MAKAHPVPPCLAEPRVRAPTRPGGLLRLLQERVLPLHFPQRHHLPVLGTQPLNCPPDKGSLGPEPRAGCRQGPRQCQVLGCTCLRSCAPLVHSGHPSDPTRPPSASVPSSPGPPGSLSVPVTTAAAPPWVLCLSAHPSAARRSTRLSVPRSVPASSYRSMARGQGP